MDATDEEVHGFRSEYAASNRSTCHTCRNTIDAGHLRIGPMVQSPKGDFKYPQWSHFGCFAKAFERRFSAKLTDLTQVSGVDKLRFEDQMRIKNLIVKEKISAVKAATDEEKTIAATSKQVWAMRDKLEALTNTELVDLLATNHQPNSGKLFGGRGNMLERASDGMTFGAMPKCPSCRNGDLRFTKGKYRCTGAADEFAKCEWEATDPTSVQCSAWKVPKSLAASYDFLKQFVFTPQTRIALLVEAENPRNAVAVPSDADPIEPTGTSATAGAAAAPPPASTAKVTKSGVGAKRDRADTSSPFSTLNICCVGKFGRTHKEIETLVSGHGGTFVKSHKDANLCVTTAAEAGGTGSAKGREITQAGLLCLSDDFLDESIRKGRLLLRSEVKPFVLANPGELKVVFSSADGDTNDPPSSTTKSAGGPQKYIVHGSAAVEPSSGLAETGKLYENPPGTPLNAIMNLTDVTTGKNSFYILQVIQDGPKFHVFRKWGRLGDDAVGDSKLVTCSNAEVAQAEFGKVYFDKTGNHWKDRKNFKKVYGKFMPIEMDFSDDGAAAATGGGDYHGPLDAPVRNFVSLIFDVKVMQEALKELEIDTTKMPLGKLSKATIQEGFRALKELQAIIDAAPPASAATPSDGSAQNPPSAAAVGSAERTRIVSLTNKFFTFIPHIAPSSGRLPLLDNLEIIQEKVKLLEALQDLEISSKLVRGPSDAAAPTTGPEHPIDTHYKRLNATMATVPKGTDTYQMVNDYLQRSHGPTHNLYSLEIVDLFEVQRHGEGDRFAKWSDNSNRMLLWHGSRITNWGGILSQGLRIAPPEAPSTGYMFGKGVYFADVSSKSANYCFTTSDKTTGIMMLCEVALGDMKPYKSAFYVDGLPKPYLSVKAIGKHHPDPRNVGALPNGCKVPYGKCISSGVADTTLLYNEYIVYDVSQVQARFVMRLEFKYNKKSGTFF